MRYSLSRPTKNTLDPFLAKEKKLPYSYPEVGHTKMSSPSNYDNDHNQIRLGTGESVWNNAKEALRNWQHFPSTWTGIYPYTPPLKEGEVVAILFRVMGIWWTNSARIVYTFDKPNRFGFAYGTLPGHIEKGEEVFWVERDEHGNVEYHIKAFSRPRFWLARLGYPFARLYQRRFVRHSQKVMKKLSNQHLIASHEIKS